MFSEMAVHLDDSIQFGSSGAWYCSLEYLVFGANFVLSYMVCQWIICNCVIILPCETTAFSFQHNIHVKEIFRPQYPRRSLPTHSSVRSVTFTAFWFAYLELSCKCWDSYLDNLKLIELIFKLSDSPNKLQFPKLCTIIILAQ